MRKLPLTFEVDDNGCFNVTSHHTNKDGYVYLYRNHRHQRAHRMVYEECYGKIEGNLVVRHKCDNRKCINPEHLELGTHMDNKIDCITRGRAKYVPSKGEDNGRSILNEKVVRRVRNLANKGLTTKEIANTLDINFHTARKVRERKTWKHVQ